MTLPSGENVITGGQREIDAANWLLCAARAKIFARRVRADSFFFRGISLALLVLPKWVLMGANGGLISLEDCSNVRMIFLGKDFSF